MPQIVRRKCRGIKTRQGVGIALLAGDLFKGQIEVMCRWKPGRLSYFAFFDGSQKLRFVEKGRGAFERHRKHDRL